MSDESAPKKLAPIQLSAKNVAAKTPYRRRIPRADRRVMLALLSGAANLSGYPLARAAQVGYGKVYVILARMESLGWVRGDFGAPNAEGNRRRFYRLTDEGRPHVLAILGLAEMQIESGTSSR